MPARFTFLYGLGAALLAGHGLDKLLIAAEAALARRPGWRSASSRLPVPMAALAVGLTAWNLDVAPYRFVRAPRPEELSPVYAHLASLPPGTPILELPWGENFDGGSEARYLHRLTRHFQPTVNGYAGFTPRLHLMLRRRDRERGFGAVLDDLRAIGVRRVVAHRAELDPGKRAELETLVRTRDGFHLDRTVGGADVYALAPLPTIPADQLRHDVTAPASARAGEPLRARVLLRNEGDLRVYAQAVRFRLAWKLEGGPEGEIPVNVVPLLVRPGETTAVDVNLPSPGSPGRKNLALELTDTGGLPLASATIAVDVRAAPR